MTIKQSEGAKFCDLVGTTHSAIVLLSRGAQAALTRDRITGWRTCPVEFQNKIGRYIHDYDVLAISGRCGPLNDSRAQKVPRIFPESTGPMNVFIGVYFDEDSWDGTDMFRPDGTRMIIVTQRAKEVLENIGATNIEFKPLLEVERLML